MHMQYACTDPYHGPRQAHGLSFSVQAGIAPPPSLLNIYQELRQDADVSPAFEPPGHGNLQAWCNQGVLLLNAALTVQQRQPASHAAIGWHTFTNRIIDLVSRKPGGGGIVFMLWGKDAAAKRSLIQNASRHCILTAPHPSPLSASRVRIDRMTAIYRRYTYTYVVTLAYRSGLLWLQALLARQRLSATRWLHSDRLVASVR
jgi:uracil-DNA glycosylase